MSKTLKIVLAFLLCIFATGLMRSGSAEPADTGERIAITCVWIAGIAWMIWTASRKPT